MAQFNITMPRLGEGITEATITKWLKKPGDHIAEEEPLAEIATDKVDSEIPSPVSGTLSELLFAEGETVEVDQVIARVATAGAAEETPSETAPAKKEENQPGKEKTSASAPKEKVHTSELIMAGEMSSRGASGRFYSPLVRNIAKQEGISSEELDRVEGTGKDGRVTKDDLLEYLKTRTAKTTVPGPEKTIEKAAKTVHTPEVKAAEGDEIITMSRMRKLIVDHMVASEDTSVHVTSVIEIDVTNLVNWRNKHKKIFEQREGMKLTFTPIFVWAVAKMLRDYPMLNSSVSGDKIIMRKNINIGMATALPDGNLIVPVIRNADHKSLLGLAGSVNDLANRARNNKLLPDEIQGGTFTLTNVGSFDTIFATPIINQPQVAILAVGAIKKKPVVLETEHGDTIAIRSTMYLSMSYDHRIIDGAMGGMALKRIGEYLQNWDIQTTV
ncbi:MAG: dihydrolipoamide acetyltransferase family protein [Bacteroidota bacterium]